MRSILWISLSLLWTASANAQQWSAEGHANYSRTTTSHQSSSGLGAMVQGTFGGPSAPVNLSTSVGADWLQQEHSGPSTTSLSFDATLQPGGSSAVTPYAGGSVSANWLSGDSSPKGALLGLQYIVGVQLKPESQGPLAVRLEIRPGYVRTQEHSIMGRLGVSYSL